MISRKKSLLGAAIALVMLLGSFGTAQAKMDLSMTTVYMSTHPTVVNAWKPWFKEIEKATKGEIKINYYNPNTLTPLNDHFDSTISGMINIGGNDCPRKAGLFKLSSVMELPGMAPSAECGSLVFWDLYQKYPELQKEYKDVKILWLWASATYQLHTTQKPVKTTDDLKGLKIICWNKKSVEIIKVLGANPIMIPPTDTYLALERGMADGVLCPLAPIVSFKISEAVKYTTVCDIFLNGFWAAMGHDLWESLTPEYQKLFVETTGKGMAQKSGLTLDQGAIADSKKLSAKGHKFIVLSKEKRAKWLDATKAMREAWVKDMESQGYKNARAIMEDAFKLSEKYAAETGRGFAQ